MTFNTNYGVNPFSSQNIPYLNSGSSELFGSQPLSNNLVQDLFPEGLNLPKGRRGRRMSNIIRTVVNALTRNMQSMMTMMQNMMQTMMQTFMGGMNSFMPDSSWGGGFGGGLGGLFGNISGDVNIYGGSEQMQAESSSKSGGLLSNLFGSGFSDGIIGKALDFGSDLLFGGSFGKMGKLAGGLFDKVKGFLGKIF